MGVDIVPYKTCTQDCVYCQIGRTTCLTVKRDEYVPRSDVIGEIESQSEVAFDCLTFAGSGEPTLHSGLGEMIRHAKMVLDVPVVVLTNGTLFTDKNVRADCREADCVMPSLDAVLQATFERVNRPHPDLKVDEMIRGLMDLRAEFEGKIWLEVMLVKGLNDGEIQKIAEVARAIDPDRVQLNTVIRPPCEPVLPLSPEEMREALKFFDRAEVISDLARSPLDTKKDRLLDLLSRRPCTMDDLSALTGLHLNEISKYIEVLELEDKITRRAFGGKLYFHAVAERNSSDL
jgi:wyosine [tRNA(Phe)-imidazoG37] synthetase (radical SAM superfamily)